MWSESEIDAKGILPAAAPTQSLPVDKNDEIKGKENQEESSEDLSPLNTEEEVSDKKKIESPKGKRGNKKKNVLPKDSTSDNQSAEAMNDTGDASDISEEKEIKGMGNGKTRGKDKLKDKDKRKGKRTNASKNQEKEGTKEEKEKSSDSKKDTKSQGIGAGNKVSDN